MWLESTLFIFYQECGMPPQGGYKNWPYTWQLFLGYFYNFFIAIKFIIIQWLRSFFVELLDVQFLSFLFLNPQIINHLLVKPGYSISAKSNSQSFGHFSRNSSVLIRCELWESEAKASRPRSRIGQGHTTCGVKSSGESFEASFDGDERGNKITRRAFEEHLLAGCL